VFFFLVFFYITLLWASWLKQTYNDDDDKEN